jgi:hypothetical protein
MMFKETNSSLLSGSRLEKHGEMEAGISNPHNTNHDFCKIIKY